MAGGPSERAQEVDLVGRDEVIAELAALLQRHGTVCIRGPAGIGKTALARATLAREHSAGHLPRAVYVSIAGACDARALLERTARALGRERPVAGALHIPTAFAKLLSAHPAVIVWDDAQDADGEAIGALAVVVSRANTSRVLIVARDACPETKIPTLVVPPLSDAACVELVERLARERGVELAAAIARRSRGNPLVARLAIGITYDAATMTPEAAMRMVLADAVDRDVRPVLAVLSSLDSVATGSDVGRIVPGADAVLRRLRDYGLLTATSEHLELPHALAGLVRELTGDPPSDAWTNVGDAAARALEAKPDDPDALLVACRALALGGDVGRSLALVERYTRARRAMPSQSLDALLRWLAARDPRFGVELRLILSSEQLRAGDVDAALRTLDEIDARDADPTFERRLRIVRARALARFGELRAAQRELGRVAEGSDASSGDPLVQVAFVALALLRGDVRGARSRLSLAPSGTALERQRALAYALSYFIEERYPRAAAWARRARRAGGHSGARPSLVGAIEVLSLLEFDEIDRAIALVERDVDGVGASDSEEPLAAELRALYGAAILGRRGDLEGCLAAAAPSYAALARRSDHVPRAFLARYMARAAMGLGRFDEADALLRSALGVASECELDALVPLLQRDVALLDVAWGRRDAARENIRAARTRCSGSPFIGVDAWALDTPDAPPPVVAGRHVRAYAMLRAAEVALEKGDARGATEPARAAEAHYRKQGAHHDQARALVALAESLLRSGAFVDARGSLDAADAIASPRRYAPLSVAIAALRASLADRTGDLDGYVAALARLRDASWPLGDRLVAALARVGVAATTGRRTALDDRIARLELDRPVQRVVATDASTFLLALTDAAPYADLEIDLDRREARAGAKAAPMTAQRLALLELLATTGGATLEQIHTSVLGGRQYDPARHRSTVYVAITRLRSALEPLVGKDAIVERSEGRYRLRPDLTSAAAATIHAIPAGGGLATRVAPLGLIPAAAGLP